MPSNTIFFHRNHIPHGLIASSQVGAKPGRMGMHYFPDALHYRDADLQVWLPALASLGVSWLVLEAEIGRAIPESFISGLVASQIIPVLRYSFSPEQTPSLAELQTLLDVYAKWGVLYISFFDRPNNRSAWSQAAWGQQDLVERFIDRFIPIAEQAIAAGITPLFPALEPGGNYWDTAFLRSALQSILRRKQEHLAHSIAISTYGWTYNRTLDWGAGGSKRWPEARAYHTPPVCQDQRGFHIADWYEEICQNVLQEALPIFQFQTGLVGSPEKSETKNDPASVQISLKIAQLLGNENVPMDEGNPDPLKPVSSSVVCSAFWLLSTGPDCPYSQQAWYTPDGKALPPAEMIRNWRTRSKVAQQGSNRIGHYLLLPTYEWGIDEVHLQAIRPFLRKVRPVMGFSIDEAVLADSVTVIGDETIYSDEALDRLRLAGCRVERIIGDGTTIASMLAER